MSAARAIHRRWSSENGSISSAIAAWERGVGGWAEGSVRGTPREVPLRSEGDLSSRVSGS